MILKVYRGFKLTIIQDVLKGYKGPLLDFIAHETL